MPQVSSSRHSKAVLSLELISQYSYTFLFK